MFVQVHTVNSHHIVLMSRIDKEIGMCSCTDDKLLEIVNYAA